MRNYSYYLLTIILLLAVAACTDDSEEQVCDVDFCVRAVWRDGLAGDRAPRVLTATDILAATDDAIAIATDDYPDLINVSCSDGQDFTLSKEAALCDDHSDYWTYTPSIIYKDKKIERSDLTFTASATIDDGDELQGTAGKDALHDNHLQLTLHHTKSLLRFAFRLSDRYAAVRYVRITALRLNDADCVVVDKVLSNDASQLIAYAYVDPKVVTTSSVNTIECIYNIYDKDGATDDHLTRKDVTARNTFTLSSLKDASDTPIAKVQAGNYYDLKVILNPDYLYSMSAHDNRHISVE